MFCFPGDLWRMEGLHWKGHYWCGQHWHWRVRSGSSYGDRGSQTLCCRPQCSFCLKYWWHTHGKNFEGGYFEGSCSKVTFISFLYVHWLTGGISWLTARFLGSCPLNICNIWALFTDFKCRDNFIHHCLQDIHHSRDHYQCHLSQELVPQCCQGCMYYHTISILSMIPQETPLNRESQQSSFFSFLFFQF